MFLYHESHYKITTHEQELSIEDALFITMVLWNLINFYRSLQKC